MSQLCHIATAIAMATVLLATPALRAQRVQNPQPVAPELKPAGGAQSDAAPGTGAHPRPPSRPGALPEPADDADGRAVAAPDAVLEPEAAQEASHAPESTTQRPGSAVGAPSAAAKPAAPADEVILVVGTRAPQVPGSVHALSSEQLERFEDDDPHAVLLQVPGVQVRQEDGFGLRPNLGLRGTSSDRSKKVSLLEDGVLFGPAPYSAPAAYYFPLLMRMTGARVIKGPAAIAQGPQTVGGAIDWTTRQVPRVPEAVVDLGYGEYGYAKAHGYFGAGEENYGFLVEGVHLHSDGFKVLPDRANTGFTRNEWMAKTFYEVDPGGHATNLLRLKLTYSDEVSNETYLGLTDEDFREDPERRYLASALDQMKNDRTSLVLSHRLELAEPQLLLTTTAYRHAYHRTWRKFNRLRGAQAAQVLNDPDQPGYQEFYQVLRGESDSLTAAEALLIGPNRREYVSQGLQSVGRLRAQTGPLEHGLEFGVRIHHDTVARRHSQDAFLVRGGELVPEGTPTEISAANSARTLALAAHLIDSVSLYGLTLSPGIRIERIASESLDRLTKVGGKRRVLALLPGVSAHYGIAEGVGVVAGVYRGFSPPPPGSDEQTRPEYSINYEVGVQLNPRALRLDLFGFYNDYDNLTDICSLASGCLDDDLGRQFDAGRARVYGVEALASAAPSLGAMRFPLSLSYTYARGKFDSTFRSPDPIYGEVSEGDEIPYLPRHQLSASAAIDSPLAGGFARLSYVAAMRERAGHEPLSSVLATDPQVVLDLGADLALGEHVELYLQLRNVVGARNIVSRRPFGARPNAPRRVQAGLRLRL